MSTEAKERADLQRKLGELLAQQRELVDQLQHGQSHFKRLARSVWRVQEDERRRLARELHDGLGQNLTAIVNFIDHALQPNILDREQLEKARVLAEATLKDARELSRMLRPQILDDLGLHAAMRWLTRTMGESHPVKIHLSVSDSLSELDAELATLVFRVAQEALSNAVRHSAAGNVRVELSVSDGLLRLDVIDDGHGCDAVEALASGSEGRSGGLGGMRDRVRLFDGRFEIVSAPGKGCRIGFEVPVPAANAKDPT